MEKEAKLLDMIPENLRAPLIEEIKEMLSGEKADKAEEDKKAIQVIKDWAVRNNPKA